MKCVADTRIISTIFGGVSYVFGKITNSSWEYEALGLFLSDLFFRIFRALRQIPNFDQVFLRYSLLQFNACRFHIACKEIMFNIIVTLKRNHL